MPVAVDIEFIPFVHPDIEENAVKVSFWRDVLNGALSDVFYKALSGQKVKDDKYLKRLKPFESDAQFTRRAMYAEDNKWSQKVVDSYTGFFTNAMIDIDTGLSEKMDIFFKENIDAAGSSAQNFATLIFAELLGIGQVFPWVDTLFVQMDDLNDKPVRPFARLLQREAVMDFELNAHNEFDWIKFTIIADKSQGIKREFVQQIWLVDDTSYRIYEQNDMKKWTLAEERPQPLPKIPILFINFNNSIPIIDNISKMQLDMMNLSSEMRNTIAVQSINLLQMSRKMWKSFKVASATSAIIYEDESSDRAGWIAPPAGTMEAAFKYLEMRNSEIKNMANLTRTDTRQAESAEAKAFDWYETEAVLQKTSEEIEDAGTNLIKIFGLFENRQIESPKFKIDEEFVSEATATSLDNMLKAQLVGADDSVSQLEMSKKARDMTIELTPEQLEESNRLLEEKSEPVEEPDTTLIIPEEQDGRQNLQNQ